MAVLLYYPLVKPPTEILHQALLYWDGIASVVPQAPEVYEAAVSPELKELRDRRLYTPLTLDGLALEGVVADRTSLSCRVLMEELRRMSADPHRPRMPSPPDAFLYGSKLGQWLERQLLSLGLAEPWEDGWWSVAVPKEVQLLVIGVLARELAGDQEQSYVPCTDRPDAHALALRVPTSGRMPGRAEVRRPAWEAELGRLLPVPAPGTRTADVLAFRERYADERQRLMRALHRLLGDLRREYEHPADVLAQLHHEIRRSAEDYRAAAKSSRIAWVNRSVTVTVALAAGAASDLVLPHFSALLGVAVGYALNVATRDVRPLKWAREGHDFSYLHRIETTLT